VREAAAQRLRIKEMKERNNRLVARIKARSRRFANPSYY
jgi:hypothetical protein